MNTEFTDQLREAMARLPAPVPPDLVEKVCRRYRRRRAIVWGTAAAGIAAVTGLAVILAVPAAPVSRTAAPVDPTTAYVVSHVTKALESLPSSTILFEKTTQLHPGSSSVGLEYSWSVRDRTRDQQFTPAGQLASDEELSYTATTLTHVVVDYGQRNWAQITATLPSESASPSPSPPSCASGAPNGWSPDPLEEAAMLRTAVSCGTLKAAGRSVIDGVSTIKLSELPGAIKLGNGTTTTMAFWVNATTYLPVRIVQVWAGTPDAAQSGTQMDMHWLPATPANEAKLTVPIPVGFTHVPWP